MQSDIRKAAISLGNIDARAVTGHPFDIWRSRLNSLPFRQYLSIEHDPAIISGWPLDEITIWVAIAPTPPMTGWLEGCGENPEHAAAIRAELGVHGLNGLLISPEYGSFVDITVLMLHSAPPPDARGSEHDFSPGCDNCGECKKEMILGVKYDLTGCD